jgi:hypothetical protein
MKKSILCLIVLLLVALSGCENFRVKTLGGTMTVNVPTGETFVNATWKDANLWIITYDSAHSRYLMHETSTSVSCKAR